MKTVSRHAAVIVMALAATSALAESSASTAASATSSAAGSLSNSLQGSSNSSSKTTTAAAGEYRIEAVTVDADRPGMVRLALQPSVPNDERQAFVLVLPQRTVTQEGLVRGGTVSARTRPYGIEFARAETRQAFFLVVADAWLQELDARPVMAL
jgi:outer membrane lipoprotein-sorting protein